MTSYTNCFYILLLASLKTESNLTDDYTDPAGKLVESIASLAISDMAQNKTK